MLVGLGALSFAPADQGVLPRDYTFVVNSPLHRYFGVQTLRSWKVGEKKIEMNGRFQMIDGATGKILWTVDEVLSTADSVYLPDDPDHVVVVESMLPSSVSGIAYQNLTEASESAQKEVLQRTAVRFYRRGKRITDHSLEDLGLRAESLSLSVSHVRFFDAVTEGSGGHWDWALEELAKTLNPRFDAEKHTMELTCLDGKTRVFDYRTGKLLEIRDEKSP